jgi:hypothetical protein
MDAEQAPSLLRRAFSRPNSLPKNREAAQQWHEPDLLLAALVASGLCPLLDLTETTRFYRSSYAQDGASYHRHAQ